MYYQSHHHGIETSPTNVMWFYNTAINRTIMELKLIIKFESTVHNVSINRTIMELKHRALR